MSFLLFLSDAVIPLFIFIIVGYGLLTGCDIYDTCIHGAIRGLKIVVKILPTLIGLMVGVGILRAKGVGIHDIRTGLHILAVDAGKHFRLGDA